MLANASPFAVYALAYGVMPEKHTQTLCYTYRTLWYPCVSIPIRSISLSLSLSVSKVWGSARARSSATHMEGLLFINVISFWPSACCARCVRLCMGWISFWAQDSWVCVCERQNKQQRRRRRRRVVCAIWCRRRRRRRRRFGTATAAGNIRNCIFLVFGNLWSSANGLLWIDVHGDGCVGFSGPSECS